MVTPSRRLAPIDWMRGLVMVLMTSDHAAHVFYRDHLVLDSAMIPGWDAPLPALPFLHRWMSHLCAPTFVFLAGTAIALSTTRKRGTVPERAIDRDLVLRGLLLVVFDLTLISALWGREFGVRFLLQVLFAIGVGMIAVTPLRRLSPRVLTILGIVTIAGGEALAGLALGMPSANVTPSPGLATAALVTGGLLPPDLVVVYPAIPWLGVLLVGYGYGARVARGGDPVRPLWIGALVGLASFLLVRTLDGYGNMRMTGVHDSWVRWLQVSKYPPSLAFTGLEVGLMCAILAGMFALERRGDRPARPNGPLLVFGQTALFFYLLHIPLLEGAGALLGALFGPEHVPAGVGRTWLAVAATLALLYPACRWFRAFKRARPRSALRFV